METREQKSRRILIAEDDPVSRISLQKVLEKLGYIVVVAIDGDQAWKIIQAEDAPQLMFLDWEMPGFSGLELCSKITNETTSNRFFYKIMLTGRTDKEAISEALGLGADDYICKPFNLDELTARLNAGERILTMYEQSREQTKRLAQADRMISMGIMAAGVAHEINNPATFISGNIQLVDEMWSRVCEQLKKIPHENLDPKVAILMEEMPEVLIDMKNGISRITEIVNGLKTFTRTDSDKRELASIHHPINESLKFCQNRLNNGVSVVEDFCHDLPLVRINSVEIQQVLVNLIINAIDAIESTNTVGCITIRTMANSGFVIIEIEDDGPGVPAEVSEQLFTPFFTTKEVGKGTGLGLSISQNIIQEHGGNISVQNDPNSGAQFRISIPAEN